MTAAKLPVVLIAGYLGAGKTTLLNHLLRHAQGRRVAVLVNDFGSINIDAELIAAVAAGDEHSAGVISLAGGCLCCSFGDDLVGTLAALARRTPPPDVCLIELSGVALPASVVRTARLLPCVDVVATLVLADAEHIQRQATDRYVGDTVLQQLQQADWLMLNKPDLLSAEALQATAAWLQRVAAQARHWAGAAQDVWPELVLDAPDGAASLRLLTEDGHAATLFASRAPTSRWSGAQRAHTLFESFSLEIPAHTDLQALGARLAAADSGVLRAKALVGGHLLQVAGGRWAVTAAESLHGGHVVMIGLRGRWNPARLALLAPPGGALEPTQERP